MISARTFTFVSLEHVLGRQPGNFHVWLVNPRAWNAAELQLEFQLAAFHVSRAARARRAHPFHVTACVNAVFTNPIPRTPCFLNSPSMAASTAAIDTTWGIFT